MKKTFDASRAIIGLASGGYIFKEGSIRDIEGHDLPTAEDILEAVRSRPEEIAADLLSVIADAALPTGDDYTAELCDRVCAGRGTAEDVATLSRMIAAGEAAIYDRGYSELWKEPGAEEGLDAALIVQAMACSGRSLGKDGRFHHVVAGMTPLPAHPVVTEAMQDNAGYIAHCLRNRLADAYLQPKEPNDVYSLSRQLAGYHHSALSLGLDELKTAMKPKTTPPAWMKPKRSAPWQNPTAAEDALEVILRLTEEGKPVFEDEPFNMPFPDYLRITKTLSSNHVSELAYMIANELHVRSGQINAHDDVIERINAKKSTKEDIRALVEELVRVTADD